MSPHEFVFRNGRRFHSSPMTSEERAYVQECIEEAGGGCDAEKECFNNAQILVLADQRLDGRLVYVEGFAARPVPFYHAWLALDGKVLDLTLRPLGAYRDGRPHVPTYGSWDDGRSYYGVEFPDADYIHDLIVSRRYSYSLIDDPESGWPFLRGHQPTMKLEDALAGMFPELSER